MQTLERALGFPKAPIYAFHGVKFAEDILHMVKGCTHREVVYVDVTGFFHVFPYGFVPHPHVNYDSQRTEHFVISDIWEVPHLKQHDVILRFSDTTCLTINNYDLPDFPSNLPDGFVKDEIAYQSQTVPNNYVIGHKYIENLFEATLDFITANEITPKNPILWGMIMDLYQDKAGALPKLDNSFELIRKEFMQRRDVRAYHNFIADMKADEFYNNRWSSEVVRYLTMAIFGTPEETYIRHHSGYMEKNFLKGMHYRQACRTKPFGKYFSFHNSTEVVEEE